MAGVLESSTGVGFPPCWQCGQDMSFNFPKLVPILGVQHITFITYELLLKTWVILYLKILHIA